jgi:DNA ligase D-like protein (predicted ligase)
MNDVLDSLPDGVREILRKKALPSWTQPMLATLTDQRFSDENWIFERKLDGERCLAFRNGDAVRLMSRNKKKINVQYPEIAEALERQTAQKFIVDGEIVAFEGNVTSFARLQKRMHVTDPEKARRSGVAVRYYIFDIVHFDGYDLTRVGLRHRKGVLRKALSFDEPLRFATHRNAEGEEYYRQACRKGWEGLIAKRADSRYVHKRSRDWLKFKCVNEQEFVIGGYTDPSGSRKGFGALLIGVYDDGDLIYAGKVGTGYDDETLVRLGKRLSSLERESSPFARDDDLPKRNVHWVTPELVGMVGFTEWTGDGKLRHPRFLGLRRDKTPKNVVREKAKG